MTLGAAVAFGQKAPVAAAMAVVGLFAVFHGHAHGAEMPETADGAAYAADFMLATAALHAAGIGFGFALARSDERSGELATRLAGGAAGLVGIALLY